MNTNTKNLLQRDLNNEDIVLTDDQAHSLSFIKDKIKSFDCGIDILTKEIGELVTSCSAGGVSFAVPNPPVGVMWHVFPPSCTGLVDKFTYVKEDPTTLPIIAKLQQLYRKRLNLLKLKEKWQHRVQYAELGALPYFWLDQYEDNNEEQT